MNKHAAFNGNGAETTAPAAAHDSAPRIPIPGHAGATIFAALKGLAMFAGDEVSLTIRKVRAQGGGYAYLISRTIPPTIGKQRNGD